MYMYYNFKVCVVDRILICHANHSINPAIIHLTLKEKGDTVDKKYDRLRKK